MEDWFLNKASWEKVNKVEVWTYHTLSTTYTWVSRSLFHLSNVSCDWYNCLRYFNSCFQHSDFDNEVTVPKYCVHLDLKILFDGSTPLSSYRRYVGTFAALKIIRKIWLLKILMAIWSEWTHPSFNIKLHRDLLFFILTVFGSYRTF